MSKNGAQLEEAHHHPPDHSRLLQLHDDEIDVGQLTHQDFVHRQADPMKSFRFRPAQNHMSNTVFFGEGYQGLGDIVVFQGDNQSAHFLGCLQSVSYSALDRGVNAHR